MVAPQKNSIFDYFDKKCPHPKKLIFTTILSKFASKIDFFFKICPHPPKNRFSIILIKKGPLIRKNWFLQSFYQNLAPQNRFSVLWIKKKTLSSLEYENCIFSKSLIQNSSKTRFYVIFKRCSRWSMQKGFFSKIQFYVTFKNIPPPWNMENAFFQKFWYKIPKNM